MAVLTKFLVWNGFPREFNLRRRLRDGSPLSHREAYSEAENRRNQIEYFEWRTEKIGEQISKVTFVTETYDFYQQLWHSGESGRNQILQTYRQFVNPGITLEQLGSGSYLKDNPWNTTRGIVHTIHSENTIRGAKKQIDRTTGREPRMVGVPPMIGPQWQVNHGPNNYSLTGKITYADTRIEMDVHMLCRHYHDASVGEENLPGIYIVDWDNSGITKRNGSAAGNYWFIKRGTPGRVLRLEYKVPDHLLGELFIGGRPLEFGGQLAEQVTVAIGVTAVSLRKR